MNKDEKKTAKPKKVRLAPDAVYERQAEVCTALSNPLRLKVLDILSVGELCCKEIADFLGIHKTTLTQHLTALKHAGLVTERKVGVSKIISLKPGTGSGLCGILNGLLTKPPGTKQKM